MLEQYIMQSLENSSRTGNTTPPPHPEAKNGSEVTQCWHPDSSICRVWHQSSKSCWFKPHLEHWYICAAHPPSGEMGTWHMYKNGIMVVYPVCILAYINGSRGVQLYKVLSMEWIWCRNVQIQSRENVMWAGLAWTWEQDSKPQPITFTLPLLNMHFLPG